MSQESLQKSTNECRAAFERHYGRWDDAAQIENRVVWATAWQSAARELQSVAEKMRAVELKGRIGDWAAAQNKAQAVEECVEFLLTNR